MKQLHPCTGCRFFYGAFEYNRCCNYIFDAGHRRPCPPGKACTVREDLPDFRISWRKNVDHDERVTIYTRICPNCGTAFKTTYGTKVYCCEKCRNSAKNRRKYHRRKAKSMR